ncbi:dienelactone hydrolase family protein [Streptacidiphilus sp. MAP12-33]|uniref:dienelactone hydrolase family protein n=1 Tax=Streptacidiphilus sp. MAP12-33 TaxID=3156266 RepID=UPI00351299B0
MSPRPPLPRDHDGPSGVRQRPFLVDRPGAPVPATVWTPAEPERPLPLVLLGHGGSGDRHSTRIVARAEQLAHSGYAAVAIDGPYHGERVPQPLTAAQYQALIAGEGVERVLDRMAADWLATRDALVRTGLADPDRQAYVGLSMGTRFGLATAVALGPSLRCAVFGKFGTRASTALHPGLAAPRRALDDAARITAPVLFHLNRDDELFPREGQLELFAAFPNAAKELHSHPGGHSHPPDDASDLWQRFLTRHLAGSLR